MTHNMETEDFSSLVPRLEELARAEDELNSPAPLLRAATKQDEGAPASVSHYLDDALELFEGERLHWTLWIWRRPWGGANHTEWTCRGFAVVCQPSEGAAYTLHEPVLASVAPYVGARAPAE